ncbi:ActS/PrrB/RegB family redox-sensitive histidine kinase [Sandarakinorhabdus sp. AAP62]|uniref:ActS/PrrB/RegB family redox-sensitive histidine kinase n=1 Tax=Sandarakinorhabdus sp. AAP62 TaxID=1248916 RepID=UPI00036720C2|nr:ActS/PrrB/RegB family redox-sensitive histidine kinase [Sandarakinorhabdus sp. AAP62]
MERPSIAASAFDRPGVRVRTLAGIRWIAILGQFTTLLVVGLWFGYPLPWGSMLAAVGASVILNVGLSTLYERSDRMTGRELSLHLSFDLIQAGVLLFLTGGLANPFSLLLIVPVTIAATLLTAREMAPLLALAMGVLAVIWMWAQPLPWSGPPPEFPLVYRIGDVIAYGLAIGFLAAYLWMVSAEGRDRARALVATEAALTREARMNALGSMAAAAAHELGGPLGSISLIAHSLLEELGDDPDFGEDIRLLAAEAARSRRIMKDLSTRAEAEDPFAILTLDLLLHEVAQSVLPARVPVKVVVSGKQPLVQRSPELLHALNNLVANAVRHAGTEVRMETAITPSEIRVAVLDDGFGFPPDLLPRLGEPILGPSRSKSDSTGLGVFIATTLIERTGGRLAFSNRPEGGARVEVRWPREEFEFNDADEGEEEQ